MTFAIGFVLLLVVLCLYFLITVVYMPYEFRHNATVGQHVWYFNDESIEESYITEVHIEKNMRIGDEYVVLTDNTKLKLLDFIRGFCGFCM